MIGDITSTDNLEGVVNGHTNAAIAVHKNVISQSSLERIKKTVLGGGVWNYAAPSTEVLRVDPTAKKVDYVSLWETGTRIQKLAHSTFNMAGELMSTVKGDYRDPNSELFMSIFTFGAYKLVRPFLQQRREVGTSILDVRSRLISANLEDANRLIGAVDVYLQGPEEVKLLYGKEATPVQLDGSTKFLQGANQGVLQLMAYFLGGKPL